MPSLFIAIHLLLSVICLAAVLRLPPGSRASKLFYICVCLFVMLGFILERRMDWGWFVMRHTTSNLPYLTNLIFEGAVVLAGLLWRGASDRSERNRAIVLTIPLVGLALFSYSWYFQPLPHGMYGKADKTGYCRQTTDDTCSPAAAVMLLNSKGITADEAEMAALCLSRAGKGTSELGLLRGLVQKSAPNGWRVRMINSTPAELHLLAGPALLAVGLSRTAPKKIVEKMREFGWEPGQYHSVVVMGGDATGKWLDVADPSYGREKWPAEHLAVLWNGRALVLEKQ